MTASPSPSRPRATRPVLPGLAVLACAASLSACGGGETKIVDASGGRPFAVSATASFEESQKLANVETLKVTVKNDDTRPLPDVAVVLEGLSRTISSADNGAGRTSDPRRPVWVVDAPPKGGTSAYVGTWALGRLAAGASKTFTWQLTPTVAGAHTLRWRAAAGLDQNAPVRASGGATSGSFDVSVSDR